MCAGKRVTNEDSSSIRVSQSASKVRYLRHPFSARLENPVKHAGSSALCEAIGVSNTKGLAV